VGPRQVCYALLAAGQLRQDPPPRRIRQGRKCLIQQLCVIFNHMVEYGTNENRLQINLLKFFTALLKSPQIPFEGRSQILAAYAISLR